MSALGALFAIVVVLQIAGYSYSNGDSVRNAPADSGRYPVFRVDHWSNLKVIWRTLWTWISPCYPNDQVAGVLMDYPPDYGELLDPWPWLEPWLNVLRLLVGSPDQRAREFQLGLESRQQPLSTFR